MRRWLKWESSGFQIRWLMVRLHPCAPNTERWPCKTWMTTGIARKGMGKACKATQRRGLTSSLQATVVTGYTPAFGPECSCKTWIGVMGLLRNVAFVHFSTQQLLAGLPGDSTNGEQPPNRARRERTTSGHRPWSACSPIARPGLFFVCSKAHSLIARDTLCFALCCTFSHSARVCTADKEKRSEREPRAFP